MYVSLPGAAAPVKSSILPEFSSKEFYAELRKDPDFKLALEKLDITKLEVRVMWKAERGAPTIQQYLSCPPVNAKLPLLDQVHEVGAGGRVKEKPAAWNNFTPRGGFFYVHVHNTAPRVVSGASVGPFRPVHSRQLCWLVC
ncbi:MAG: hypothetical protein EOO65_00190 [Methanosarcinales archaeon]|nr:MAG: hypothetical protein EOO65_00190 [Methanosarcinales archaeon]